MAQRSIAYALVGAVALSACRRPEPVALPDPRIKAYEQCRQPPLCGMSIKGRQVRALMTAWQLYSSPDAGDAMENNEAVVRTDGGTIEVMWFPGGDILGGGLTVWIDEVSGRVVGTQGEP